MPDSPRKPSRRWRSGAGQATLETLFALMFILLVFFSLLQVGYLFTGKTIINHASSVTARSHIVGFDRAIVQRAMEVGSIGLSGHPTYPYYIVGLSTNTLGAMEPSFIQEFISARDYTIHYEHWDLLDLDVPNGESDSLITIGINVRDYPLDFPMTRAYTGDDTLTFSGQARMYNHAAYYLE